MANVAAAWKPQTEIDAEREAAAWERVRAERDRRISATDWIMLPDAVLPKGTTLEQWQAYRQALRDVPQGNTDPHDIAWPEPPEIPL